MSEEASDEDVERIASRLVDYIRYENLTPHTLKLNICEALYEMQAIARGQKYTPTILRSA